MLPYGVHAWHIGCKKILLYSIPPDTKMAMQGVVCALHSHPIHTLLCSTHPLPPLKKGECLSFWLILRLNAPPPTPLYVTQLLYYHISCLSCVLHIKMLKEFHSYFALCGRVEREAV